MNYGRRHLERVLVFRPHNVYGPDMGREHVIPQFVLRAGALAAEHPDGAIRFPIQGDGSQTRAFVHVDDFTDGLITVLEKGAHLNIYHVGSDERSHHPASGSADFQPPRPGIRNRLRARCRKAARREGAPISANSGPSGTGPALHSATGLAGTIDWYLARR